MAEIPPQPFSRRYGCKQPKETRDWEDAPDRVRGTAVDKARLPIGPKRLHEIFCSVLKLHPEHTDDAWSQVESPMSSCEWFHVYDAIEAFYAEMVGSGGPLQLACAAIYEKAMNECFKEESVGWQLANGAIVTRGTEAFERDREPQAAFPRPVNLGDVQLLMGACRNAGKSLNVGPPLRE